MKVALPRPIPVVITPSENSAEILGFAKIDPDRYATTVHVKGFLFVLRPDGTARWWPSMTTPSKEFRVGSWKRAPMALTAMLDNATEGGHVHATNQETLSADGA